jgi:hypothetical protein
MKSPKTTPAVPLRRSAPSGAKPFVQPNPLKPRYSPSLETFGTEKDKPNPIFLCVTCRSKDLSQKSHFFWLWKRWRFVCNECGTTLQQVGDKYKLSLVTDPESTVWRKYAGKILHSREWANIANGGLSDEEIIVSWTKC